MNFYVLRGKKGINRIYPLGFTLNFTKLKSRKNTRKPTYSNLKCSDHFPVVKHLKNVHFVYLLKKYPFNSNLEQNFNLSQSNNITATITYNANYSNLQCPLYSPVFVTKETLLFKPLI